MLSTNKAIFRCAGSSWCMDELVKMKEFVDKEKLQVIPIFYNVRARDVRKQTGKFGEKFWKHARESSGDQIKKWKEELEFECISDKMGLSLKDNSSEAYFIKKIVKEVKRVIAAIRSEESDHYHVNLFGKKRTVWNNNYTNELDNFKRIKTKF